VASYLHAARLFAQAAPDVNSWATYGPLGLIVATLIAVCWYFIRRESARADRWEAIALKSIEANHSALKSNDSAHMSVTVVEDLLRLALEREGRSK
jgi:hypothetical protein